MELINYILLVIAIALTLLTLVFAVAAIYHFLNFLTKGKLRKFIESIYTSASKQLKFGDFFIFL